MDQVKNFSISIVQTAPSPATSGTSLTVSTGQGSLFPTGSFDLTMWPPNVQPNSFNAEIARCSFSGDVATLTRHQYGTTAQAVGVGWQVAQNVTAQLLTSGGGSIPYVGTSPQNPVWLAPVAWVYENSDFISTIDSYTYANGTLGVGATMTQNTPNAVLTIDGGSPSPGDRVVVWDYNLNFTDGLYVVSAVGNGSTIPWVLTRATDNDTPASLFQFWAVTVVRTGTRFPTDSQAIVTNVTPGVVGGGLVEFGLAAPTSVASGPYSVASGFISIASAAASVASAPLAVASGHGAIASGLGSIASGLRATAYGDGQEAHSTGDLNRHSQYSRVVGYSTTTDATPTALSNIASPCLIRFVDAAGNPVWDKTIHVKATVVARDTTTPGTDSCWSFQGVLRGNATSAYTWIGGTAPSKVLIAQDAGASPWNVALSIGTDPLPSSAAALIGTVTGATSTNISWECTLSLDEVTG